MERSKTSTAGIMKICSQRQLWHDVKLKFWIYIGKKILIDGVWLNQMDEVCCALHAVLAKSEDELLMDEGVVTIKHMWRMRDVVFHALVSAP